MLDGFLMFVTKNITLKLREELMARVRHLAVDDDKSVSAWVADVIDQAVRDRDAYEKARRGAVVALRDGFHLGNRPMTRDSLHER